MMGLRAAFAALLAAMLAAAFAAGAWAHDPQPIPEPTVVEGASVRLEGRFTQGGLILGMAPPGAGIMLGERPVPVAADGRFVIGFGRDHGPEASLSVTLPDGQSESLALAIVRRDYAIQRIDGLPQAQVTPPPELLVRIRADNALIAEARGFETPETWFADGFAWPVIGPISGVYGSQRILNGEPRRPHYGVDMAAPTGTIVAAPAAGIVRLAEDDLYFTGGTVVLDHGYGVTSAFLHMSEVLAVPGQFVAQGDAIGRVGATGRVTGAHLDWRINWGATRIDPQLLVPPMPPATQ
jgi:hypothetical protein